MHDIAQLLLAGVASYDFMLDRDGVINIMHLSRYCS